jgi:hypothetical protein
VTIRIAPLILCGALGVTPAAELVVRDIGGGLVLAPTSFTYDLTDGNGTRSGSDTLASRYGIEATGMYSFAGTGDRGGPVAGGGLHLSRGTYGSGGGLDDYGIHARGGWAWAWSDQIAVAVEGRLAAGFAEFTLDGGDAFPRYRATGPTLGLGAGLAGTWAFTERLAVRLDIQYRRDQARLSGDGADLDLIVSGPAVALTLAWRASATPFLLE